MDPARRLALAVLLLGGACAAPPPAPEAKAPPPPPDPAEVLAGCSARLEPWGGIQYVCPELEATYLEVEGRPGPRMADAIEGARPASPEIRMTYGRYALPWDLPGLTVYRLVFTRAGETAPAHVALVAAADSGDHARLVQCGGVDGPALPEACPDVVGALLAHGPPPKPAPTPAEAGPPRIFDQRVEVPDRCRAGVDPEGWSVVVCEEATLMWLETEEVHLDPQALVAEIESGYRESFDLRAEAVAPCALGGHDAVCRRFHLEVPESARADTILVAVAVGRDRTAVAQCVYEGPRTPEVCASVIGTR